jgi:hypothetical protein
VGVNALGVNSVGAGSVAVGNAALSASTGDANVALGTSAGLANTSGTNNTFIGSSATATAGNFTNATAIGNGASVNASNKVRVGNAAVTVIEGQVNWSFPSDARDKTDIVSLPTVDAIAIMQALNPVQYRWDRRDWYDDGQRDGSKKASDLKSGFIAQELLALQQTYPWLDIVNDNSPDSLSISSGNLIPVVVKACQELAAKAAAAEARADAAEARLAALEEAVLELLGR